jgi:hypothetical protein
LGYYVTRGGLTTGVPIVSPPTGSHFRYGTLSWQPLTSTIIDSGGSKREVEVRSVRSLLILKKVILCKSMSRQEAVNEMRPYFACRAKGDSPKWCADEQGMLSMLSNVGKLHKCLDTCRCCLKAFVNEITARVPCVCMFVNEARLRDVHTDILFAPNGHHVPS